MLWWAFRREWWPLLVALGTTAGIVGISLVLAPGLWTDWLVFVLVNRDQPSPLPLVPVSLPIRLLMSGALLAWAAPRGHRWAVPIAAGWAIPALYAGTFLAVWVASIRLAGLADGLPIIRRPLRRAGPLAPSIVTVGDAAERVVIYAPEGGPASAIRVMDVPLEPIPQENDERREPSLPTGP